MSLTLSNKIIIKERLANGVGNIRLVDGVRQLESSSGLSYTIIQGVFAAKRDLQFTTLLGILGEGLEMTLTDFAKIYDSITDDDIKVAKKEIAESVRIKMPKKQIKKKSNKSKLRRKKKP